MAIAAADLVSGRRRMNPRGSVRSGRFYSRRPGSSGTGTAARRPPPRPGCPSKSCASSSR
ncbi:hypothetical protein PSMK_15450 [Phycisphaera mikurensis NBRC 102666]|uniref:Uncharacterized protein n=1 Tax=Phycisphaera mikurensis (strain NBRC 102666 / KCTC 22515 / FYK2301M01) TaxID=1142394 RepID=I0IEL6_PHYMF|nr:hypothetical protein PSMK_15450 [Phycisphaera mikurensis NBRC 102666]